MRRVVAVAMAAFALMPMARAQTPGAEPTRSVAVVLRVPLFTTFVDVSGKEVVEPATLATLTRSLDRWTKPPFDEIRISLAVGPALCDALGLLDTPEARRALGALRRLAQRADVLTVPYADVWLPYLEDREAVHEQLVEGTRVLRACLRKAPSRTLFAHVLHTGGGEPTQDVDTEAVGAAHSTGIDHVVARGLTQTPVRSDELAVVPFIDVGSLRQNEDGSVREPAGVPRFALVTDANEPEERGPIARLVESGTARFGGVPGLAAEAPRVAVAFADDPDVPSRYRAPVVEARRAVESFNGTTTADNPIRTRLKVAFAQTLATASKDAEVAIELGERGNGAAERAASLERFVERELEGVRLSEGSVTFTSRRGAVPVTIANRNAYPIRVRVSVSSPKLTFPNRRTKETRVVEITPPGDTITFEATARSTGTFPVLASVKTRNGRLTLDATELRVRSTATNLSALILTGGGAIFLLVFLVRRAGRRRGTERSES